MHPPRILKRPTARPQLHPEAHPLQIRKASSWVHLGTGVPSSGAFVPARFEELPANVRLGQAFTFSVSLGLPIRGLPLPPGTAPEVLVWLSVELPDGTVFPHHTLPPRIRVPIKELTAKVKDVKIEAAPAGGAVWIVAYGGANHFRGEIIAEVEVRPRVTRSRTPEAPRSAAS